jgi:hypothetical protein
MMYYPLPPMVLVDLMKGGELHRRDAGNPDAISPGNQTFACQECHNVGYCTRLDYWSWNQLIGHITGGLLYGREVPRPGWFELKRTYRFAPRLKRATSKRRQQVREALERGLSFPQIAKEIRIDQRNVGHYASEIYRQARVKNIREFREKFCGVESCRAELKAAELTSSAASERRDGDHEHPGAAGRLGDADLREVQADLGAGEGCGAALPVGREQAEVGGVDGAVSVEIAGEPVAGRLPVRRQSV